MAANFLKLQKENKKTDDLCDQYKKEIRKLKEAIGTHSLDLEQFEREKKRLGERIAELEEKNRNAGKEN